MPGSHASSGGAYVTGDAYVGGMAGRYGSKDSALPTAMWRPVQSSFMQPGSQPGESHTTCLIGRSEGCFAMTNSSRDAVMAELGAARLIYADKG
jgi:hypothetical protein